MHIESIIIDTNTADKTVEFKQPLKGEGCAIALKNLTLWNSWHNINSKFKNNTFGFECYGEGAGKAKEYTIPDGNYTVVDLNNYFKNVNLDIKLSVNFAVSRFVLEVGKSCVMDLTTSSLHKILGFPQGRYVGTNTGPYLANISRGIDMLFVHCDLISDARYNEGFSNVLYSFTPKAAPGTLIDIHINDPIYHKVNVGNIRRVRLWITDQNDQIVDLNEQMVVYSLLLKSGNI